MKAHVLLGGWGLLQLTFFFYTDKKQLTECWAGEVGNDVIQEDCTPRLKIWVALTVRFSQIK